MYFYDPINETAHSSGSSIDVEEGRAVVYVNSFTDSEVSSSEGLGGVGFIDAPQR